MTFVYVKVVTFVTVRQDFDIEILAIVIVFENPDDVYLNSINGNNCFAPDAHFDKLFWKLFPDAFFNKNRK